MTAPLSSPDPTGPHPGVDELADLAEGLVESAETAEALRRHLADCPECRETTEALAEVQALLGAAEAPPMPADIAERLDAALAAAATETDAAEAVDKAVRGPQEPSRPGHRGEGPTRPARPATAASAPPGRPAAGTPSTAPGSPGPGRTRRRRARLLLGAAAALFAVGLGGALLLQPDDRRSSSTSAARADAPAATSVPAAGTPPRPEADGGTAYREDALAAQIQQLLAQGGRPGSPAAKPSAGPPVDGEQGIRGHSATACPAPVDGTPLATDRGSFAGAPAEVLVYAVPGHPDQLDVYLRTPDCGPVLLHRTVPTR
ncbi:anti-sigma factor family protein [Kitasatospora sp. NPDC052868]|uniref:anti-sigma factor family protein n=1 Tax=Kitasatospora sp. NPDC052868 TaxID=3364060 RepID=UPI0037C98094